MEITISLPATMAGHRGKYQRYNQRMCHLLVV